MMFLQIAFEVALQKVNSHSYAMTIKPLVLKPDYKTFFIQGSGSMSAGMVQELQGHAPYISSEGC